ncbi:DUF2235 domain-containing protein [Capilliphycus salinus ALCB114379]|uniref:DUF2235 domain-containing protein n=1 Tax=Capilliphycus salinus TaxID=2768948 RepID=UPI0039A7645F
MKRLIICCDGTWQSLESPYPTNVVKIALAVKPIASDDINQVVYYDEGIGTGGNILTKEDLINFDIPLTNLNIGLGPGKLEKLIEKSSGGAFGKGIDKNIQDAYRFLCINYSPGDEIYLFGFSRGAYTVRSLSGMLYSVGLLKHQQFRRIPEAYELYRSRDEEKQANFREKYCYSSDKYGSRIPVTLLGCWDTVGSLGIPDTIPFLPGEKLINQDRYKFHSTALSENIENALHAVAIDEDRDTFQVTPMVLNPQAPDQKLFQVWFPGDHGCVGGGTREHSGLSDGALVWMMDSVGKLGLKLEFDPDLIPPEYRIHPKCDINYKAKETSLFGAVTDKLTSTITRLPGTRLREVSQQFEDLHESVKERWVMLRDYRPKNLEQFIDRLNS